MKDHTLAPVEARFADLIWEHAPLSTAELVKLAADTLGWKRTTTYTVLKRLSEEGLFASENRMVTVKISKAEYEAMQSEQFVEDTFDGSLPAFLAAFSSRKKLSDREIDEIQALIQSMRAEP